MRLTENSVYSAWSLAGQPDVDRLDKLTVWAVALAPLFLLTVRSWTNGFLAGLAFLAVYGIWRRPQAYQGLSRAQFFDSQHLERTINAGKFLFDQAERLEFVVLDGSFPRYLREHPEKFSNFLAPV